MSGEAPANVAVRGRRAARRGAAHTRARASTRRDASGRPNARRPGELTDVAQSWLVGMYSICGRGRERVGVSARRGRAGRRGQLGWRAKRPKPATSGLTPASPAPDARHRPERWRRASAACMSTTQRPARAPRAPHHPATTASPASIPDLPPTRGRLGMARARNRARAGGVSRVSGSRVDRVPVGARRASEGAAELARLRHGLEARAGGVQKSSLTRAARRGVRGAPGGSARAMW